MTVGDNIRNIRELNGLTLEDIGGQLGVSKQYVSQLETGCRVPNVQTLVAISNVLHCTPNDILGFKSEHEVSR